jgi:hypothetical protein
MHGMMSMTDLPERLQSAVNTELRSGERLHWMDRPVPRFFAAKSVVSFVFGIPWTAFALFWTAGAAGFRLPDFSEGLSFFHLFPLFGLPFIAVGIGMLLAPVFQRLGMERTVYLLTDRRAIMIEGVRTTKVRDIALRDIADTTRYERQDGRGDIQFLFGGSREEGKKQGSPGFYDIPRVHEVERLLDDLRERARPARDS